MTDLAQDAFLQAQRMAPTSAAPLLDLLSNGDTEGGRLMRIMIAKAHPDPANLPWLLAYNGAFASPFEHYWCILTLLDYQPLLSPADQVQIAADLNANWTAISADTGRNRFAQSLLRIATHSNATATSPKTSSTSAPTFGARGTTKSPPAKAKATSGKAKARKTLPPTSEAPKAQAVPQKPTARKRPAAATAAGKKEPDFPA
jgi:hypothetical protein